MSEHEIKFGTLHRDGTLTNTRAIPRSAIAACPHYIMVPEHYREDNTCRCNDPEDRRMFEWGYQWKDGAWR